MKSTERYKKLTDTLLMRLHTAEFKTDTLLKDADDLHEKLRRSKWTEKGYAMNSIRMARITLVAKKRLKLIQGGNEFLARRSRAVLTLINCEQINETQTKRGA